MLDIDFIRNNPEKVKKASKSKGVEVDINSLLKLDKKRRKRKKELDDLRAKQNDMTEKVQKAEGEKKQELISKIKPIKEEIQEKEDQWKEIKKEWRKFMLQIPNIPASDVPEGEDESENEVVKQWGDKPKFDFEPKDHLELGESLNLIDVERSAKTSGTRFGFLKNEAVRLEFALIQLAFDFLSEKNFVPIIPPVLLNPEMMEGMGYLQRGKDEIYFIEKDDLYLAGTAEQPLGAMHASEELKKEELPKRYMAFSPCFRREAGSYGRDTRGIFRVHQFDKVEMFSFCEPDQSEEEHKKLLSFQEELMQKLNIPYQVVQMCTGDLGDPAANKLDIEAWMPGQQRYRETHSTSNCTDFQARRLNIKFRDENNDLKFVHTTNGTAFAIGRTLIAILENFQTKEGKIEIPEALHEYLNFKEISK